MEYMTAEEKTRLEAELKALHGKRRQLSERIGNARELGDLRENAEYHASREDQGMNEAKIRELETRLSQAVIADAGSVPDDMVFVGATVRLRDTKNGKEDLFKLVGESTGNFDLDYVEVTPNSALGLALMKSRVGETIRVNLPKGERRYEIVEIVGE
jgi:transcription elongation factor GreA